MEALSLRVKTAEGLIRLSWHLGNEEERRRNNSGNILLPLKSCEPSSVETTVPCCLIVGRAVERTGPSC